MARKKKTRSSGIDPEFIKRHRASLIRRHRQVIYLNDRELSAIEQYCAKFNVRLEPLRCGREALMLRLGHERVPPIKNDGSRGSCWSSARKACLLFLGTE